MIKGSDIRTARNRAGLSQEELAARVGVTLRTIGNWERTPTVPRDREHVLRTVLADHLDGAAAQSPRLRSASDEEVLAEIARRFAQAKEEGQAHGNSLAEKSLELPEVVEIEAREDQRGT